MRSLTVVGGGIAGLGTAALAAARGWKVTLLESRSEVGGRAGLHTEAGFAFDTGPSWYLMPEVFDRFFSLLGQDNPLNLHDLDPGFRVWPAGLLEDIGNGSGTSAVDVPRGTEPFLRLVSQREPGAAQRVRRYVESASDTYRLALEHFLYTNFTTRDYTRFARPDVLARLPRLPRLFGQSMQRRIEQTVTDPVLQKILGYPAVFLGTQPKTAPSMYHLMTNLDVVDGVRYPMGGMRTIITAMAQAAVRLGVDIRTDCTVTAVRTQGRRVVGVTARCGSADVPADEVEAGSRGAGSVVDFDSDAVVAACDLEAFEALLPMRLRTRSQQWWARRDYGIGAVTLLLGVDRKLPKLHHHNLFFTSDWDSNFTQIFGADKRLPQPASAYVCAPSRTDAFVAPADSENLFVLVPAPADPQLRTGSQLLEQYADRIIDSLGASIGVDLAAHLRVRRAFGPGDIDPRRGSALGPANVLSQSAMFRFPQKARARGLVHAGAYTAPGVGLPMCLISAENAVDLLERT
ncbi:Dehydrosqualene desaturase [Brevibacterium ravenspurgense]|uniref:Dehydrosqualene desaturase n=1 Tax=Brevibacterium ravenspurgense TaxID=479117 RepID=A0A150H4X8_9MICO|nr:phytoene desaturase family protein [Brevibacterium ravenspurgense]KXZ57094.1 Dehydrosqualene desaturase [Brevibacterium ravenspurgense]